jgi:CheY-like chemotaxis protein
MGENLMKQTIATASTVLIVEDELALQELICENLQPHFAKILVAANGLNAIEILNKYEVDVIVTDYRMPKMNGLDLIKHVKANHPLLPVIMLTANGSDPAVLEAIEGGAFDILDKPVRFELLVNRIQNGLLFPELLEIIWAAMTLETSALRIEEFLKLSFNKQLEIIHAFGAVLKTKAMAKKSEVAS